MARTPSSTTSSPKLVRVNTSTRPRKARSSSHKAQTHRGGVERATTTTSPSSSRKTRSCSKRTIVRSSSGSAVNVTYNARVLAAVYRLGRHKTRRGASHVAIRKHLEHRLETKPELFSSTSLNSTRVLSSKHQLKEQGLLVSPTKSTLQLDSETRKRFKSLKEELDGDDEGLGETDDEKAAALVLSGETSPYKKKTTTKYKKQPKLSSTDEDDHEAVVVEVPLKRKSKTTKTSTKKQKLDEKKKADETESERDELENEVDELESDADEETYEQTKSKPVIVKTKRSVTASGLSLSKLTKAALIDKVREATRQTNELTQELAEVKAKVDQLEHDKEVLANGYNVMKERYTELREQMSQADVAEDGGRGRDTSPLSDLEDAQDRLSPQAERSNTHAMDADQDGHAAYDDGGDEDNVLLPSAIDSSSRELSPLAPLQNARAAAHQTDMSGYESDNEDEDVAVSNMLVTPEYSDRMPEIGSFGAQEGGDSTNNGSEVDELAIPTPSQQRPARHAEAKFVTPPRNEDDVGVGSSRQLATPDETPVASTRRQLQLGRHTIDMRTLEPTLLHDYGVELQGQESSARDEEHDGVSVATLKRDFAAFSAKKANLEEDVQTIIQRFQDQQQHCQATVARLEQERDDLTQDVNSLRRDNERLGTESEGQFTKIAVLEMQVAAARKEVEEASDAVKVHNVRSENLREELELVTMRYHDAELSRQSQIDSLQAGVDSVTMQLASERSLREEAKAELVALQWKKEELENTNKDLRESNERITREKDNVAAARKLDQEIRAQDLAQANQQIGELQESVRGRDSELDSVQAEMSIMETQINKMQAEIDKLEKKLETEREASATELADKLTEQEKRHEIALAEVKARADLAEETLRDLGETHHQLRDVVQQTVQSLELVVPDGFSTSQQLDLLREHVVSLTRMNADLGARLYTCTTLSRTIVDALVGAPELLIPVNLPEEEDGQDTVERNLAIVLDRVETFKNVVRDDRTTRDAAQTKVNLLEDEVKQVRLQLATRHDVLSTVLSRTRQLEVVLAQDDEDGATLAGTRSQQELMDDVEHAPAFSRLPDMLDDVKSKVIALERRRSELSDELKTLGEQFQKEEVDALALKQHLDKVSAERDELDKALRDKEQVLRDARPMAQRLLEAASLGA
ncbi:hypothetical protein ACM66B_003675 [Microbotryomycetes sp. NB124-2]